jgi:hypothetical protein
MEVASAWLRPKNILKILFQKHTKLVNGALGDLYREAVIADAPLNTYWKAAGQCIRNPSLRLKETS